MKEKMKIGDLICARRPGALAWPNLGLNHRIDLEQVGVYMGTMNDRRFKGEYIKLLVGGEMIMVAEWLWKFEVISETGAHQ
jgi:hypothetical protein